MSPARFKIKDLEVVKHTKLPVPRLRRLAFIILAAISLCFLLWQSARMQSPLRRITNTTEEGKSVNPAISGDGRIVAFESTEDIAGAGGVESFRAIRANVSVDPATFQQMGATRAPAPAVSQDGSRIAFASKDNPLGTNGDGNSEIFLFDGAKLVQVTSTSPGDIANRIVNGNFLPSISDDGRFIAFSSNRDLAGQNADGSLEVFIYDTVALSFTQFTNATGIVGFTDAKISGNGSAVAYIRDRGTTPSAARDLLLQNRLGGPVRLLATGAQLLATTYGRAISDDGQRVVYAAETAPNSSQVFLFDGRNNLTRQLTTLGVRTTDVALQATISGDGSRIAFATRRPVIPPSSDAGVDLYTYDIPSGIIARVTNAPSTATAEVVSSLNDDGSIIAFNFPRVLSGPVSNSDFANDCEIYVTGTTPRPAAGTLTILNGASFGHEPATTEAVAPDSIAVARGSALSFVTQQSQRQPDGTFPLIVGGTRVTVNGVPAQIFYVSPTQVNFHVPVATALGTAEVVITNSEGFESRGTIQTLRAAPGVFTFGDDGLFSGEGVGEGAILNADTLTRGPFDPSSGNLRLIIFATGVRNGSPVTVTAGGRSLTVESIVHSQDMPGMDEIHVLVPADLRGAGKVDLVVRADTRDSNPVEITFQGDAGRDILINEFMADPPEGAGGDANHDGTRDGSQDEFVELVNTTTRDIDISGYQILTRGTSDVVRHTFAAGTILPSCTAIVVFGGGNPNPSNPAFGGAQVVKATGGLSLTNSAGVITLRDSSGNIVNFISYGGSTGLNGDAGQSLTRAPDLTGNFTLHGSASGSGGTLFSPGTKLNGAPFTSCAPIARIDVSPPSATIEVAGHQQFTARAFDAAGNEVFGVIFSWQSSNTTVATIDQTGLATGKAVGTTEIRASGRGVQSAPATLTVNPATPVLTSITITPTSATIGVGETQQFTAQAKDQLGNDIGGVTITFASNNPAVATVDSVSATSSTGSATANVTGQASGSAQITATATNGSITVTSSPAILTVEPGAGQVLISEFRTRGPSGLGDEFVEIYNPTLSTVTIGGLKIRASNSSGGTSDRVTIAAGTTLGSGCHYLVANSSTGGYSGAVTPNQTYGTAIADDGGIAIIRSNGTTIIDAVGMSNGSAYKEGTPLAPLSASVNQSYERKPGGAFGNGTDTNNNATDFFLNAASSNPQNSSSGCLDLTTADLNISKSDSPDPVTTGTDVTYTIVVTNNGAANAQSVVVTDNLPGTVTFVSCSSTGGGVCGGAGNNRTINFASLASGASATITLVATANGASGSTITNTATVTATTSDPNASNNSATAVTTVQAPLPLLSINDVSLSEGNAGTTTFTFTVSLSAPASAGGVTFDITTADGTATVANSDYVARSLAAQTIPAGQQTYTFDVTVNGDVVVEPNEIFFVNVTNVSSATVSDGQGQGTIQNDDTANVVISQLYGGGGNTGAQFTNDFIEIFNRGNTTVDLAGWSVQYNAATDTDTWSTTPLCPAGPCLLLPGKYFLVREGSTGATNLPTPDAVGTIAMAATSGKVLLSSTTTALAGACPASANIQDLVGYGASAATADFCFEGSGPAPAPGNTTADFRKAGGCTDTNDNAADFFVSAPFPRNSSSPVNNCVAGAPPTLTINDVTVAEGNSGTVTATFTVSLSAPAPSTDVAFDIGTQNNTATTANNDYVAKALTGQVIPAGQQTYTFTVTVNGDTAVEPDETFLVNVTNVNGATVGDGQGIGTIANDDLPALTINDVSQNEGNSGTTTFTFTVSLSTVAPAGGVTFDIATQDNTATVANNDYVARTLTGQTIPAGSQTYTFDVTVNGDVTIEPNESFFVNVTNVSGAVVNDGQGLGTILNDDSPTLSINDVSQEEGNSGTVTFTFTVTSTLPAGVGGITFDIATQDNTATVANNDYVARSLTSQTIAQGNTTYTFDVTVNGDTLVEPNETFFVNISNVSGASVSDGQGVGTIQNDDTATLVISQVYAGGGNTGAQFTNDFVEIFNRGTTTVSFAVTPYSIQYAGATSSFGSSKVDLTSGTIAPGQYFLVQLSGGAIGSPLPTPDASGSIAMAATAGKVALVAGTTALSGSGCPLAPTVADFVGYGTTADCFEGSGRAPAPSNTTADLRKAGGCTDTNDNAADFFVFAPSPRNTSSPFNNCTAGTPPNLTINDVTVVEGNSGTTTATFTVSLSAPAPSTDVTFDIATQNNTATTANADYVAKTLTSQIIPAGQQTYTFTVTVNGDTAVENDETFFVNVTNVAGATVTDGQGVGTIQNDDLPSLSINDVSLSEGNAGTKLFTFTVSLSAPAPSTVTFDIATQDGSATVADNDYVARSLTGQTIAAGLTSYTFDVTVNGDVSIEPNETFLVNVTNVSGAIVSDGQGTGTIQNDDSPVLTINDVSLNEGDAGATTFTFTVTSSLPAPPGGITFDIATADGTAQDDNPASEDNDYVARSLTGQTIPATQTTYTFDVTVNGDTLVEPNETFFVNLTNVSGATVGDGQGQGTIQNDDTANVVISQLYGGGGNTGAQFTNDFVELFNRGTTTVDLAGWSVQYNTAGDTDTWSTTPLCPTGPCLLLPGRYFLVREGSAGIANLPAPDAVGTIAMAATTGKLLVSSSTTALSGACPSSATITDIVGYGTSATCFEGTGPAPAPSNTTADVRKGGGCVDTNDNAADFFVHAPSPRNSANPANNCTGQTADIVINDVTVTEGNSGTVAANFTVSLIAASASTVTVDYSTSDGTANAPADYQAVPTTQLVFNPGETSKPVTVLVNGDTLDEPDETFFVNLSNATNAAILDNQGQGTITDDDVPPLLTINDVSLNEGNSGTTTFAFTVHLSAPALTGGVTFDIATADGTAEDDTPATEDNDYVGQSLTAQTIPAGMQDYTFNVTVNGDSNIEASETFFVNVTNVSGTTVSDGQGQGTIQNDDSPTLSINDVSANETNSGTTIFTFTVTSSLPAPPGGITFDIATADGTAQDDNPATEDNDYVARSLTAQTITAGNTTYTFDVTVNGDTLVEPNETFFVNVTNVINATVSDGQGQGTIQNDDAPLLVITQIYGGGNNAGATFQNDFVEIFNRSATTTVNFAVTPYSVQYASAAATSFTTGNKIDLTSGTLAPGQYFLIKLAGGTTNGVALPTADATNTAINMSATDGKVALVIGLALVSGTGCPIDTSTVADFIGYGSANCAEGTATAVLSATKSARRTNSCTDTNANSADFTIVTNPPAPRNSATPLTPCP